MKHFLLSATCLLCSYLLFAEPAKIVLNGKLLMQTGEEFTYRIEGVDSGGYLVGFGYTYDQPNETKVLVKGRIDKQKRTLVFKETEIVSSHDMHTEAFMCLLRASLQYKTGQLTGKAIAEELDNTACTPGTITFAKADEVNNLFSTHDKFDMEIDMGAIKPKEAVAAAPEKPVASSTPVKQEKITAGVSKTYDWYSDSVVVEVWDGGTFDGDRLTISMDGTPFLTKFVISERKKRLVIPIATSGMHSLLIFADEEGREPPNTASLTLADGAVQYHLLAYNPKGQSSLITIDKKARK